MGDFDRYLEWVWRCCRIDPGFRVVCESFADWGLCGKRFFRWQVVADGKPRAGLWADWEGLKSELMDARRRLLEWHRLPVERLGWESLVGLPFDRAAIQACADRIAVAALW